MSKADKDGWIRHRGGKQPLPDNVLTQVILRKESKKQFDDKPFIASDWEWSHCNCGDDVMYYREYNPAEQVESCSKPELQINLPDGYGEIMDRSVEGPLQWRDRITEIDATTQALTAERANLVQKLASEGFALIGRVVELVEDYGNIQIGDLVSVISIGGFSDCTGLSVGDIVEVTSVDNDESLKTVSGGSWGSIGYNYKFHSRPSA